MNESYIKSQLGFLHVITENRAVKAVLFMDDYSGEEIVVDKIALKVKTQLEEYFSGQRKNFELDLKPDGTEFQQKVWSALLEIPFGRTVSYHQQAVKLGDVKSIRAVASANGRNPIAIIIPCHRVIGSDGTLTGYAGGLHRKQKLLELETGVKQSVLF